MRLNRCFRLALLGIFVVAACGDKEQDTAVASPRLEGTEPGDCSDAADNDGDGLFDCDDDGCSGAPDCDESVLDADADGYTAVEAGGDDCDDTDGSVNPGARETCNAVDDDCDGEVDEEPTDGTTWYPDDDGDGFGDPDRAFEACSEPSGFVEVAGDCDDTAFEVNPVRAETCNDVDDDCDGAVDEEPTDGETWYRDGDGDGFGNPDAATTTCTQPSATIDNALDCDDTDPEVFPGAVETCNGVDDDCDSTTDGWSVPGDQPTIQAAIDAAASSELVCVGAGRWNENLDFQGKDIRVEGELGSALTILLPEFGTPGVLVNKGETTAAVFAGFTIDGASSLSGAALTIDRAGLTVTDLVCEGMTGEESESIWGGVVSVTDGELVMEGARFENNRADFGGSSAGGVYGAVMYLESSTATLTDVSFLDNEGYGYASGTVTLRGGALYASGSVVTLERVDFEGNSLSGGSNGASETAGGGAAAFVDGSQVVLTDVTFVRNSARCGSTGTRCDARGGALFLENSVADLDGVQISESTIYGESSTVSTAYGGGLYASASTVTLDQVQVTDNQTWGRGASAGGGVAFRDNTEADLTNVIVAANTASSRWGASEGGGLYAETGRGFLTVTNADLVANGVSAYTTEQGGGLYASSEGAVTLTNVGLVENTLSSSGGQGSAVSLSAGGGAVSVSYGNVYGNTGGSSDFAGLSDPTGSGGNISVAPGYRSQSAALASGWDLTLDSTSACIDAGDPSRTDVDGSVSDIGTYGGPGGGW
jgi:hypothetical protein